VRLPCPLPAGRRAGQLRVRELANWTSRGRSRRKAAATSIAADRGGESGKRDRNSHQLQTASTSRNEAGVTWPRSPKTNAKVGHRPRLISGNVQASLSRRTARRKVYAIQTVRPGVDAGTSCGNRSKQLPLERQSTSPRTTATGQVRWWLRSPSRSEARELGVPRSGKHVGGAARGNQNGPGIPGWSKNQFSSPSIPSHNADHVYAGLGSGLTRFEGERGSNWSDVRPVTGTFLRAAGGSTRVTTRGQLWAEGGLAPVTLKRRISTKAFDFAFGTGSQRKSGFYVRKRWAAPSITPGPLDGSETRNRHATRQRPERRHDRNALQYYAVRHRATLKKPKKRSPRFTSKGKADNGGDRSMRGQAQSGRRVPQRFRVAG